MLGAARETRGSRGYRSCVIRPTQAQGNLMLHLARFHFMSHDYLFSFHLSLLLTDLTVRGFRAKVSRKRKIEMFSLGQ